MLNTCLINQHFLIMHLSNDLLAVSLSKLNMWTPLRGFSMLFINAVFCTFRVFWNVGFIYTERGILQIHISEVCNNFNLGIYIFIPRHCVWIPHRFQKVSTSIPRYIKNEQSLHGYSEWCKDMLHHLNLCQPICYVHLEDVSVCLCHIELSPLNYMTFLERKKQSWHRRSGGGVAFVSALIGVQK